MGFNKKVFSFTEDELLKFQNILKSSLEILETNSDFNEDTYFLNVVIEVFDEKINFDFLELKALKDLVNGTLFHLNLNQIVKQLVSA
ncbi:hypothetical protein [Winogradskyella haliclonae]|uniref:hypothetical protein n=1 Tax=Winogradskyella haliclonae TaxID=2048558 RepID=UPI00166738DE|nr:hypothetical protein [Winogradskyella haliclonae]